MRMDRRQKRTIAIAGLSAFFAILAVNLFVPVVMVSVMGLVDRLLMRLWYGIIPGLTVEEIT